MTPRKSQQHLKHRSRWRRRSVPYVWKRMTKRLVELVFQESPVFKALRLRRWEEEPSTYIARPMEWTGE